MPPGSTSIVRRSEKLHKSFTTSRPVAQVDGKVHHRRLQTNLIQQVRNIPTVIRLVIDRVKNHVRALHLATAAVDKLELHDLLEEAVFSPLGIRDDLSNSGAWRHLAGLS